MTILQTIAVAFAMFSAIPMPQFEWSQKNMRYALCAFPLIGAVCGGLWCLAGVLPVPELVRAAGFCLVPVLVTGGIHLDGFADTCDALSSYGDAEKKLEILKDPHCGAFAVIRLCTYFILYFALCASVKFTVRFGVIWILALTLERAFSGLAVASFPMAKNTGLAHTFCGSRKPHNGAPRLDYLYCRARCCDDRARRLGGSFGCFTCLSAVLRSVEKAIRRHHGRPCRVVPAKGRARHVGSARRVPVGRNFVMVFITGPLYSGKRTFAQKLGGTCCFEVQKQAETTEDLEALAKILSEKYDIITATEVGGGVVPVDATERANREKAGRLACLLAARADCVVQMFCGIPTVLKGELPK